MTAVLTLVLLAGVTMLFSDVLGAFLRWPPGLALRHIQAAPNCDAARAAGLAPAFRGQPGYYPQHDADGDGIACEPWSGFARRSHQPYQTHDPHVYRIPR